ncbi:hypothetical protein BKG80_05855 [Mycobacteroides chelonae]|uniref:acyl carrier protein n=1 Tax=Mycobacteroides chelonae TaxID=1774 RepID=UPI0008A92994|nr:hypothetical protein [Mycobacteroides chelonae]MBF9352821.1 acyl carrier protein [Mycobacteroides chelonae]OHU42429.1 hypothetical protein BKG80_05855 [Mycobacteroides chelonae]
MSTGGVMELTDIEEIILEYLAEDAGTDAKSLRSMLEQLGERMPVSSLLAVQVLVRVQNTTGVVLPAIPETAAAMRSVRSFAEAVYAQLPRAHTSEAATA